MMSPPAVFAAILIGRTLFLSANRSWNLTFSINAYDYVLAIFKHNMAAKVALPGRANATELIVFRVALLDDLMIRLEKSRLVFIVERVVIGQT
jgi:hypothetical protein